MPMDYYAACSALGIAPGADMTQIKNAYRTLSKQYHPDNGGDSDAERFTMINEAYSYLEKLYEQNVYTAGVSTRPVQPAYRSKVIGGVVTSHPGSFEERERKKNFEKKAKAEEAQKKLKARKEMEERREKLQEEKEQRKKEKDILNQIKMIRLAHAIEAMLAPEAKE